MLSIINFKKLPEIFIISFDNIVQDNVINYYLNMDISNEPYILICIIINKDENNKDVSNYNVFYKKNKKWFIYDTHKKETRNVNDIKLISQNPLVCYYQKKITHINILMNNLYDNLKSLYEEFNILDAKIKKHIVDAKNFQKYYIVNKKWFNKLTKIFEEDEIYNSKILFENFSSIINIHNLNTNQKKNLDDLFFERKQILENENLFFPEFDNNKETGIKYPKEFIVISENYLNKLLQEFDIDIKSKSKTLYEILLGENYLFIKDKTNPNIIFVCYNILFLLNIEKIFLFNNEKIFEREINNYIKNKGLEAYYEERNLDIDKNFQNIIDKENEEIGKLVSIINNNTMINLNKFFLNHNTS